MTKKQSAFTLIELLVVISIIGLLVAILLPSLNAARTQARRVTCASQLHQVGIAMVAYTADSRNRMPYISYMPSIGPGPLVTEEPIYFADILKKQLMGQIYLLECPDDRPGRTDRSAPNTGMSYYESERSSYEYRTNLAGRTIAEIGHLNPPSEQGRKVAPETVWFARDYDNLHGKAGRIGTRRYAYIDGHVGDYEN